MNNKVDISTPLFVLIDEIKRGNLSLSDLTEAQIKSLPKDVLRIINSRD